MTCLLRRLYNLLLMVLLSIPVCLLFLSILGVSGLYFTLSSLIVIHTSLLLRCLLSDMYGNLFSIVIMLSPLISRILIYIFQLLSIIIFRICLEKYAISVESLPFTLATAPSIFTALTKHIMFLYWQKGFHIFICLDDIFVLIHYKWERGHSHFCVLYWFTLPHWDFLFF